ncbi:C4-dicarboxylate TRAP transporter substrate-binding protein [Treponema parvum]|uniref:C4-dicarboxylate TRAP transporter substrate-binding protein n=1 Tax=Treponema parvum TaxID=138851 RepID=UPI001AEC6E50|nr:C4-dicarboxylate TRAP transporter substrate-binding protein [Treponema parvum]QTQ17359.1 TRAP transporter substrate-binding protein DctP [Treponema parvum]
MSVEVFTNSALGDTDDILEQAIQGAAVLTVTDPGRLADYIPEYGILQMPYIMEDHTKIDPITSTKMVSNWEKGFEEFGVKVLTSNWYGGARQFVCNKAVNVPTDLNGLKIRTMGSDLCIKSITAMGAVGTAMPQSQIYSGIEQKALDGCENQSTSTYASRLYEICKYINKTGHFILLGCPATGTIYFNSLPEDYQQLLVDTFKANGTEYQSICAEMELKCEQDMAANYGVTIHEVDKAQFKKAVQPVYTKLGYDELRNTILEEAGLN